MAKKIVYIEQEAELKADNNQAFYVLGMLTGWMGRYDHSGTFADKQMVKYWRHRAAELINGSRDVFNLENEPGEPQENFKSLLKQFKDGDLWVKD